MLRGINRSILVLNLFHSQCSLVIEIIAIMMMITIIIIIIMIILLLLL